MWNFIKTDEDKIFRVNFKVDCYDVKNKTFIKKSVLMDSGCFNTIIPLSIAEDSNVGIDYKNPITVNVGNLNLPTYRCIIEKIRLVGEDEKKREKLDELKYLLMFAVDIPDKHELEDTILLGLNIMNNWHYSVYKNSHQLLIDADPINIPDFVPNKKFPYLNSFDINGNYVFYQEGVKDLLLENETSISQESKYLKAESPPTLSEEEIRHLRLMELYQGLEYKDKFSDTQGGWNVIGPGIDRAILDRLVNKGVLKKDNNKYQIRKGN